MCAGISDNYRRIAVESGKLWSVDFHSCFIAMAASIFRTAVLLTGFLWLANILCENPEELQEL